MNFKTICLAVLICGLGLIDHAYSKSVNQPNMALKVLKSDSNQQMKCLLDYFISEEDEEDEEDEVDDENENENIEIVINCIPPFCTLNILSTPSNSTSQSPMASAMTSTTKPSETSSASSAVTDESSTARASSPTSNRDRAPSDRVASTDATPESSTSTTIAVAETMNA